MTFNAAFVLLLMVYQNKIISIECQEQEFSLEELLRTGKADPEWSFSGSNGPDTWADEYSNCNGKHQSPVNLYSKYSYFTHMEALNYSEGYFADRSDFEVRNVGKFVTVTLPKDQPCIEGGGLLNEKFCFVGVVFQWSSGNSSEQRGHRWAKCMNKDTVLDCDLEMQVFHTNNDKTEHVVTASCFKVKENKKDPRKIHQGLKPIENLLDKIKYSGNKETPDTAFSISSLFNDGLGPEKLTHKFFFVYNGSIPFPPCDENTQYYFYRSDEYFILQETLDKFRGVYRTAEGKGDEFMLDNYRPTQEWEKGRTLYDRNPNSAPPYRGC